MPADSTPTQDKDLRLQIIINLHSRFSRFQLLKNEPE